MPRIQFLLLLLGALCSWALASSAPTFCKCTCFKNSTIIPLGPQSSSSQPFVDSHRPSTSSTIRSASASCAQCTKAFCLDNRIPFCADATEADVVTLCFQRDSNKDRVIVWGFMVGVVALLGTAAFRRGMEWRRTRAAVRGGDEVRGRYTVLQAQGTPEVN